MNVKSVMSVLLPKSVGWAEEQQSDILATGRRLTPEEIGIARAIGVGQPERIRVKVVPIIPMPQDPVLVQAAQQAGFGPNMAGLTLFYGIFIRQGTYSRNLFAHECHHVYQYEKRGSIEAFLQEYLPQIFTVGYNNAPLEVEARVAATMYELTLPQ